MWRECDIIYKGDIMYKRFRDAIVFPEKIIQYRKDSFFLIFAYILLFSIVLSTYTIIYVASFDQIDIATREQMNEDLITEAVDCQIVNSELVCTNQIIKAIYDDGEVTKVFVDSSETINFSNYDLLAINVIFHKDEYIIYVGGLSENNPIADLPLGLQNIDFNDLANDHDGFSEEFITGVEQIMIDHIWVWGSLFIAGVVFVNMLLIIIVILLVSWILKSRFRIIPFKEIFRMATYVSTTSFIILTFNNLLGLYYFFMFLLIIISFRQVNKLSIGILKVIKK